MQQRLLALLLGAAVSAAGCKESASTSSSGDGSAADARACTAPDGSWRCRGQKPSLFGVTSNTIPTTWTVSAWFVDPQNASGTASDQNNCTSSGTPCSSWQEIATGRWGCGNQRGCVRLRQNTTVTWISSQTTDADPVYIVQSLEAGASLTVTATLPTASLTSAFTSVTNWGNVATQVGIYNDSAQTGLATSGRLILDTTISPNPRWWCSTASLIIGGTTGRCIGTIPIVPVIPPSANLTPGLYTALAGGTGTIGSTDNYSQYQLRTINLAVAEPVVESVADGGAAGPQGGVYLYQFTALEPSPNLGTNELRWGPGVTGYDLRVDRVVNVVGSASAKDEGCVDCWLNGGIQGGRLSTGHYWHMMAGELTNNILLSANPSGNEFAFDGYAMLDPTVNFWAGGSFGLVAVRSVVQIYGYSTVASITPGYGTIAGGAQFLGTNVGGGTPTLNAIGPGTVHYTSTATATFPGTGLTFEANGQTTACSSYVSGTQVQTCGITINQTNLDASPANSTQFNGIALGQHGGSFVAAIP